MSSRLARGEPRDVGDETIAAPRHGLDERAALRSVPSVRRSAETACSRLLSVTATSPHAAATSASFERTVPACDSR